MRLNVDIESLDDLRERWSRSRCMRIENFLDLEVAESVRRSLCEQDVTIKARPTWSLGYQYFEYNYVPEAECDHELCEFGRWWRSEATAWVQELVGAPLVPSPDGHVMTTLYTRGSYLDAHNDYDGHRMIAFVLGLTREKWPAEQGGHLEFLDVADNRVQVRERRPPGWATLDLFEVGDLARPILHRIPLLTWPHQRRVISGWFYKPA